jgi:hypothetical protein
VLRVAVAIAVLLLGVPGAALAEGANAPAAPPAGGARPAAPANPAAPAKPGARPGGYHPNYQPIIYVNPAAYLTPAPVKTPAHHPAAKPSAPAGQQIFHSYSTGN